ncbi:MAG: type II toxin-antitoxin system Phd/YefM family antitoxin [Chloroflexota bacterium]
MKSIAVTDLRQRTAQVLEEVRASEEPYVILQRSQKAAYLVDATTYDAQMEELRQARRQLFLREVREAEAELAAGKGTEYGNVEDLIGALDRQAGK